MTRTSRVGVPKEIKAQEHRVGLIPAAAADLVKAGHEVVVQAGAGVGSSYPDDEYRAAGAVIVPTAPEVFDRAGIIVKVKEPQPAEIAMLRPHHVLFTYLHLAASKPLTEGLLASGCTAIAYETVLVNHRLPLLEPMSEVAGRMAPIVGSYHLAKLCGGRGVLLGGVPGAAPGRVAIIGGGTAGWNAARVAVGIGADVTILEVDFERIRFLDATIGGARTLYSTVENLARLLPQTDLVIGAVLVPGAAAPKVITREMLRLMRPGAVLVDIAVDQGGCAETTRPTTHESPTYVEEGVVHYCVANMPGAFARTATEALGNVTHRWTLLLANQGVAGACRLRPEFLSGINCAAGKLTCAPVGDAHGIPVADAAGLVAGME